MSGASEAERAALRHARLNQRLARAGYAGLALFLGTVGVWAVATPLSGAVIAPATFIVENRVRRVQHPVGGLVSHVMVREGDKVAAGDVLLRLDETMARTNLQITSRQLDEARARVARLEAERDRRESPEFPAALSERAAEPEIAQLLAAETRIFAARAASRAGMRSQLSKRVLQLRSEIDGLKTQEAAKAREAGLNARELEAVRSLFQRNLVQMSRLAPLEREAAQIEGVRGGLQGQIAQLEGRIAETELQILQIDEDARNEVLKDLREAEARIAELSERRIAAEDQFRKLDIRAPVGGVVHQMSVNSAGAVLNPAEPILSIVPLEEELHLEARIQPSDYDQISLGQPVRVRLHAFNPRLLPDLAGTVSRMSADTSRETQTGATFYTIRVTLPPHELKTALPEKVKAGMQADVFITTGTRTPATYLIQPLADQFARAFRER